MATFIDQRGPVTEGRPAHQTLEDVAEEMLNGILCHYEPPDPRRHAKKKRRGILRPPRLFRKSQHNSHSKNPFRLIKSRSSSTPKSVRWSDEKPPVEDLMPESNFSLAAVCVDASVEAGCMSPTAQQQAKKPPPSDLANLSSVTYEDNDPVVEMRKENNHMDHADFSDDEDEDDDVVDDDEEDDDQEEDSRGKRQSGVIPPPPPPPPPPPMAKKEKFEAQLCGVKVSLVGDEDDSPQGHGLPRDYQQQHNRTSAHPSSATGPSKMHQRQQMRDYNFEEEEENSIVQNDNNSGPLRQQGSRNRRLVSQIPSRATAADDLMMMMPEEPSQYNNQSYSAGLTMPQRHPQQHPSAIPHTMGFSIPEKSEEKDWETSSSTSSAFFRRMWPLRRARFQGMDTIEEPALADGRSRSRSPIRILDASSRSRSLSPHQRGQNAIPSVQELDPIEMVRAADDTQVPRASRSALDFIWSMSPRSRRAAALADDWDNSVPIVPTQSLLRQQPPPPPPRGRWSLPSVSSSGITQTAKKGRDPSPGPVRRLRGRSVELESRQQPPLHSKSPVRGRNGDAPSEASGPVDRVVHDLNERIMRKYEEQQYQMPSQLHPAHRLQRPMDDDALERQSFITAHRQIFDRDANPMAANHREDDKMSFITAHRQSFDHDLNQRGALQYAHAGKSLSHEDLMERASYITAHRQSLDGAPGEDGRGRVDNIEKQAHRSRSASPHRPYNRNHSYEREFGTSLNNVNEQLPAQRSQRPGAPPNPRSRPVNPLPATNKPLPVVQHQLVQRNGIAVLEPQPRLDQAQEVERHVAPTTPDLAWEERTRMAWERLRGSTNICDGNEEQHQEPSAPPSYPIVQSPSLPREQPSSQFPNGILRNGPARRVTFGEPSQKLFVALHDDSRSVSSDNSRKKKKKVFRGSKLFSKMFRTDRHDVNKIDNMSVSSYRSLEQARTQSTDMMMSMSKSSSYEWEGGPMQGGRPVISSNSSMYEWGRGPMQDGRPVLQMVPALERSMTNHSLSWV